MKKIEIKIKKIIYLIIIFIADIKPNQIKMD